MGFIIRGLGSIVPQASVTQGEAATFLGQGCEDEQQAKLLERLFRKTGIGKRHISWRSDPQKTLANLGGTKARMEYFEKTAPKISIEAAQKALKNSGVEPSQVSHLITTSCTGFFAPGIDIALIKALNLPSSVSRTNVGFMGCHGAFNGMKVANALCKPGQSALLVCTELCSLHLQPTDLLLHAVANSLFADGSAALVGTNSLEVEDLSHPPISIASSISHIVPGTEELMSWRISDSGFVMTLSPLVADIISEHLPKLLKDWLSTYSLNIEDISGWAIHPGGPKILDVISAALSLDPSQVSYSRQIFSDYGNMSSPTVLFILEQLRNNKIPRPYVMLGFGPGLAIEGLLLTD